MNSRTIARRILRASAILLLLAIAWVALSGVLSQIHRSQTIGQGIETGIQLVCGLLCLLTAVACLNRHRWYRQIRTVWAISLATTAGMSSLVWGPPMMIVGLVFAAVALLVALTIIWMLRVGGA